MVKTKSILGVLTSLVCALMFCASIALFAGCGDTITIKFKLNYPGASTMESITIPKDSCVEDSEDAEWPANPTRTNYTFKGWYKNADGDGDKVTSSTVLKKNTTLYAFWVEDGGGNETDPQSGGSTVTDPTTQYTITFNASTATGGSVSPTTITVNSGSTISQTGSPQKTLPTPTTTDTTKTFSHWRHTVNNSSTTFTATTTVNGNITVYAVWTNTGSGTDTTTYTITLNPNGGSGGTSSLTVTTNSVVVPATPPTRSGFTFAGYTIGENGTGTVVITGSCGLVKNVSGYTNSLGWAVTEDKTLYAKWDEVTKVVKFRSNGGYWFIAQEESFEQIVNVGSNGKVTPPSTTNLYNSGNRFGGWSYTSSGTNAIDFSTETFTSSTTIVYAIWTTEVPFEYTVSNGQVIINSYTGTSTSVTIPGSIDGKTVVGFSDTFNNNDDIVSVSIPASVTSLSEYAFASCENLVSVTFGSSSPITSITRGSFKNCPKLENIILPNGVTSISYDAFLNCYDLEWIVVPAALSSVREGAFGNCGKLRSANGGNVYSYGTGYPTIYNSADTGVDGNSYFRYSSWHFNGDWYMENGVPQAGESH